MPVDADGTTRAKKKCYRCGSTEHRVSKCKEPRKNKKCTLCGSQDHRKKHCRHRVIGKGEDKQDDGWGSPFEEAIKMPEVDLQEKMTLLGKKEWVPASCYICGRVDPGHTELECPLYEKCWTCGGTGSYGYVKRHRCQPQDSQECVSLDGDAMDADFDLYWDND